MLFRQPSNRHHFGQLEFGQHFYGNAQLSFAAIDDQQIG